MGSAIPHIARAAERELETALNRRVQLSLEAKVKSKRRQRDTARFSHLGSVDMMEQE